MLKSAGKQQSVPPRVSAPGGKSMSFLSKLFKKGRSQQLRDSDDSDDEAPGPLSAPDPLVFSRRGGVDGNSPATARRAGGELRRSKTYEAGRFAAARSSTSSSDGASLDDKLRQQYRKVKQCHLGRNATILEGVDRITKRHVMIKAYAKAGMSVVKRDKVEREVAVLRAAGVAAAAGIVKLQNVVDDPNFHYTVLEMVPGYTLIELMANNGGRLAEGRAVIEVVVPLLRALTALHALGIVHRDIKPEHIICSYGTIRLLDFFHAAQKGQQCLNYQAGQTEYMAPEMASKPRAEDIFHEVLYNGMSEEELPQYDEKVDVWSAGAVCFEALTGQQVFPAEGVADLQKQHNAALSDITPEGVPTLLTRFKLSSGAEHFLSRMLCRDPAQRASAEELLTHPWIVKHTSSAQNQWLMTPAPPPVGARQVSLDTRGSNGGIAYVSRGGGTLRSGNAVVWVPNT